MDSQTLNIISFGAIVVLCIIGILLSVIGILLTLVGMRQEGQPLQQLGMYQNN